MSGQATIVFKWRLYGIWHGTPGELTGQESFVPMKEQPLELTIHTAHVRKLSKGIHNTLIGACLPISSSVPNMEIQVQSRLTVKYSWALNGSLTS